MMTDLETEIISHIEDHIGPIEHGWSQDSLGNNIPFMVLECKDKANPHIVAFVTVGLSKFVLNSKVSDKKIRHEIVFVCQRDLYIEGMPSILIQIGNNCIKSGFAYLRGDAIGPLPFEFDTGGERAIYFTSPSYFGDEFAQKALGNGDVVIFAWGFWISALEAKFIAETGWMQFEKILEEDEIDVICLDRASVV